jgi:uncharacterized membrane protein YjfL (UPF0719 family)
MSTEEIGLWAGFVLTLMVFSYLLGDNFLYRLAVYLFVGLVAGYVAIVTVESILLPWLDAGFGDETDSASALIALIPVLFVALLLLKTSPRFAPYGNFAIGLLIGVGAAVAVAGALAGTLLPLSRATAAEGSRDDLLNGAVILFGVICSLIYFQYVARRTPEGPGERGLVSRTLGTVGQGFIVVTLGALYGAAIITSLTIFSERVSFLLTQINGG